MIIVSQNKEEIVNFDNVTAIYITKDCSIIAPLISGGMVQLGLYPSPDRAKEILEELVKFYILDDKKEAVPSLDVLALINIREHGVVYMPEK